MNDKDSDYLKRELQATESRIRVAGQICPRCDLKSSCYYSRQEWEDLDDEEFLSIKENCPIRRTEG